MKKVFRLKVDVEQEEVEIVDVVPRFEQDGKNVQVLFNNVHVLSFMLHPEGWQVCRVSEIRDELKTVGARINACQNTIFVGNSI